CLSVVFFLQSYGYRRALHSFPTRRSSDLSVTSVGCVRLPVGPPLPGDVGDTGSVVCQPCPDEEQVRKAVQEPDTIRIDGRSPGRSEEHTSELQSRENLVCRLLLEKKKRRC